MIKWKHVMNNLKVGVFHPGTQHSWQTALAFQETKQLQWYLTSVFYDANTGVGRLINKLPNPIKDRLVNELKRRSFSQLDTNFVHVDGLWEWGEVFAARLGFRTLAAKLDEIGNRRIFKKVNSLIENKEVDVIWGYNNSSLESFKIAKQFGVICVLDQTIGHPKSYNSIIEREQSQFSRYFLSATSPLHSTQRILRNDEEVALADLVIVGSKFCAQTMIENGCAASKIRVVPYGYDESIFSKPKILSINENAPVQFLFVGSVIPRKGIHYLLEAFKDISIEQAKLTIVGGLGVPQKILKEYESNVTFIPSLPRSSMPEYYNKADVFIFPSLFEGGGIVLYEACSAGLAIIQSKMCGDGVGDNNGIVLEDVNTSNIKQAVDFFIKNKGMVLEMKEKSINHSKKRKWSNYRQGIRDVLNGF